MLLNWTEKVEPFQPANKFCTAQLVMNSDKYVLSAIAFVLSMKKYMRNTIDYVCFVNGITEEAE